MESSVSDSFAKTEVCDGPAGGKQLEKEVRIDGKELATKEATGESYIAAYVRLKSVTKAAVAIGWSTGWMNKKLTQERDRLGLKDIRQIYAGSEAEFNVGTKKRDCGISASQLEALIEKQEFRCALSGVELEPGSASLDHKRPLSCGGEHVIDNVQWLHMKVNAMKGQMGVDEFVGICCQIADLARS